MGTNENKVRLVVEVDTATAKKLVDEFGAVSASALGDKSAKATEASRLGFFALGNAIEDSARQMGVAGQASRQMGNSIERIAASSLPGFGTAIGVAVLTITSIVAMYKSWSQEQKDLSEAMIKSGAAISDETIALEKNRFVTEEVKSARYNLYQLTRQIAVKELEMAISAQTQKIIEQVEVINKGGTAFEKMGRALNQVNIFSADFYKTGTLSDKWAEQTVEALKKPKNELERLLLEMAKLQLQKKQIEGQPLSKDMFESDISYDTQFGPYLADYQKYVDERMKISDELERRETEYEEWRYAQKKAANDAALMLDRTFMNERLSVVGNALDAYVAVTGKQSAVIFGLQKALAIAQIWVDTGRAAMSAAAASAPLGPYAAAAASAAMWELGTLNMAIAAGAAIGQLATGTWDGSSGSSGSTGTSSGTTSATSTRYSAPDSEADTRGTGWTADQGTSSLESTSKVQVEITVNDEAFSAKVNKSVQQNIRDRGETAKVITRYT